MNLCPNLLAAADMCAAGEDVNLDELAFLLRYAADELSERSDPDVQHEALLAATRRRLTARAELLRLPAGEIEAVADADVPTLLALEERLDSLLTDRFPATTLTETPGRSASPPADRDSDRFRSGPDAPRA